MRNLASFQTSLNFGPPAFENAAKYPNFERKCNAAMTAQQGRIIHEAGEAEASGPGPR